MQVNCFEHTQYSHARPLQQYGPRSDLRRSVAFQAATRRLSCYPVVASAEPTCNRRRLLAFIATTGLCSSFLAAVAPSSAKVAAGDWSSPGLAAPEDDAAPKFFKTARGVKVQQLAAGSGPEAQSGDFVLFDYVLRRSNGYFIYGKWL